jgi:hypothetical protein
MASGEWESKSQRPVLYSLLAIRHSPASPPQ